MIPRPARVAALAVLAGLLPAPLRAQPVAPRALLVRAPTPACAAAPAFAGFVDSLRVELAQTGPTCCTIVAPDAPIAGAAVTLDVATCDAGADDVGVTATDRSRGTAASRNISLADVAPDARPRALALAVAELVRSLAQGPPAETPAAPPPPSSTGARPPAPPATRADAAAEADLRVYPGSHTSLWGGRLALGVERARWRAGIDVGAASGGREVALGSIDVRLASASLAVGPRFLVGTAEIDLGLVGELGWARIQGVSGQPGVSAGSGSGLTAAVGGRAAIAAPAAHTFFVRVTIEAGGVARSLTGNENGAAEAGISGPYLLVGVSVGGRLGRPSPGG